MKLLDHQKKALNRMHNGCILNGGVGSGKSFTALAYYFIQNGGVITEDDFIPMDDIDVQDLYIITTAKKRDSGDWEREMIPFLIGTIGEERVTVDSWNNIAKYKDVDGAFFIFDEQRVVGKGAWVKSFLQITKGNSWILLSATPGDCWMDYVPVFIANGYYKNRSEFEREHVIYKRFSKFPAISGYIREGKLIRLRNRLLVDMDFERPTVRHDVDVWCNYDRDAYKRLIKTRFDEEKGVPFTSAGELCYALRKVINTDESRYKMFIDIIKEKKRVIVFYNFNYELELLELLLKKAEVVYSQWNGRKHEPIPDTEDWVYLVQYTAGCEGWNCTETDSIIFWSQTYSYKQLEQAKGRIDRMNTEYKDLYYYHFKTKAPIDICISQALKNKRDFNAREFISS